MRGKTIHKKALIASVIAAMFLMTWATMPSFAQTTVVSAPIIFDTSLVESTTFTVEIMVYSAENLWGYQFTLYWDPDCIGAVGFFIQPPLNTMWPSDIGSGYATIAASLPLGTDFGLYGDWVLARITFHVLGVCSTFLDLQDVSLVDPEGAPIASTAEDGFFTNREPKYKVEIQQASIEHSGWIESVDPDNTLTATIRNFGTVTTRAKVVYTVMDEAGVWSQTQENDVELKPKQKLTDQLTITKTWLILNGAPPPYYGAYHVAVKVLFHDVDLDLWLSGRLVKTVSFTFSP